MIPDDAEFRGHRAVWQEALEQDLSLRQAAVNFQLTAERYRYTYLRDWCGVPVIRLADDIVTLQEIIFAERPTCVIEVGVARGGGLLLNASLMEMAGIRPAVLGIDRAIFQHARNSIAESRFSSAIELLESDSTSEIARNKVADFVERHKKPNSMVVLILDSNHTESHVLAELQAFSPLIPVGSLVLVADTLIEEFPTGHYSDRPWDVGNNPLTAVNKFLSEANARYGLDPKWARHALVTEFRDGILRRLA